MTTKILSLLALSLAILLVPAAPAEAQRQGSLQQVYNQAVKDYESGKLDEAEAGFKAILKAKPGYVYARRYLSMIDDARKNPQPTGDTLEKKLAALTVPKFSLENAALGTVLTFLTQKSTELSNGEVTANFIYKGPAEDREKKTLTLNLANLPLTEVIRYVGLQTGTRFTYDKYAVVGVPVGQETAEGAAASGKTEEAKNTAPVFDR